MLKIVSLLSYGFYASGANQSSGANQYDYVAEESDDYKAMCGYWHKVNTIVEGLDAMRKAGEKYLPKFPNESQTDYDYRRKIATMTNIYGDVVESLANKPFSEECGIIDNENAPESIIELEENIDGRGNHIHVFLSEIFYHGINSAIDWILIDYPVVDTSAVKTVAQEKALGVRPYWVQVRAEQVLDVHTEMINGIEQLTYVRIREADDRVREFKLEGGVVSWVIYLKNEKGEWWPESNGVLTIDVIPMVPFYTGRRKGNSWQFKPPLKDAADLQVELWQKETALKHARNLTCFPMLAANGITPDRKADGSPRPVPVGPGAVLYAPPNDSGSAGSWATLAADAASLVFLATDIKDTQQQIRELGKQPLTAQSGNVTRITAAFAASKGNNSVQKWALNLKDAAEQALLITGKWIKLDVQPEVRIFTDFPVEMDEDKTPDYVLQMRSNGDLSRRTLWTEMKRRQILSSEFDPETEDKNMVNEVPVDDFNDDEPPLDSGTV